MRIRVSPGLARVFGVSLLVTVSGHAALSPNLLIIQTDEHHFGTLGCYGGEIVPTALARYVVRHGDPYGGLPGIREALAAGGIE